MAHSMDSVTMKNGTHLPSTSGVEAEHFSAEDKSYIPISQFYAGRSVFITGGTGFMGKVLVEKLLRSCPDIENIYLLIRPKYGVMVNERLKNLLNGPLFAKVKKNNERNLSKVVLIPGDITSNKLGISDEHQKLLFEKVSVVFHSAATVKFDEKLKLSVQINMLGTKRLVELCHKMKSLEALIHVSTAYCNCDREEVSEDIYDVPYNPEDIISLINWLPEDMLDKLTPSLIGKRPNTYTFTKALAEHMLQKEAAGLPVAIVRPSIVIASLNEPCSGWVDNFNGPTGLVAAVANGLFRTMMCEKDFVADMVPVDIVINLMIAAAWRTATAKPNGMSIYNCCTGQQHPITWGEFVHYALNLVRKHPLESCYWYPTGVLRMNRPVNAVHGFIVHYIPAYFFDTIARLIGKKPILVSVQNKIAKSVACLEYFSTRQWSFNDDNVRRLQSTLSPADSEAFMFDVKKIVWGEYVERYILGFREFLFKHKPETLPASRKLMTRLYYYHQFSKVLVFVFTWRFLLARSKMLRDAWMQVLQLALQLGRLLPHF